MVFRKPIDTDFLSRLTNITILIIGLNIPISAYCTGTKGKERVEYYQASNLDEYESFDDFYLVMNSLGFPNLISVESDPEINKIDFKSPKSISVYKSLINQRNEEYRSINTRKKPIKDLIKKRSKEEIQRYDKERNARTQNLYDFEKKGYHKFFKSLLKENGVEMVNICISANRVELGLLSEENTFMPYSETQEIVKNTLVTALADLGYDDYSNLKLVNSSTNINCDATVDINSRGLDILNMNSLVGSITNPKLVEEVSFSLH